MEVPAALVGLEEVAVKGMAFAAVDCRVTWDKAGKRNGTNSTFTYDANGQRVIGVIGVTTVYIGGVYEYQAGTTTQYYEGNALRRTSYASNNGVFYLLQDHLKSSGAIASQTGVVNAADRDYYLPFGGNRGGAFSTLTTKRFTGQYHEASLPGGEGLSYYGARWYDAKLGRFLSADTVVPGPGNPQAFNRYAYVLNRPTGMVDPSGHCSIGAHSSGPDDAEGNFMGGDSQCWQTYYTLKARGVPKLNWRWRYKLGDTIAEWAAKNFATGKSPLLRLAGGLSGLDGGGARQDVIGYELLTIGNNVAEINGHPTYHMYLDSAADMKLQLTNPGVQTMQGVSMLGMAVTSWIMNWRYPSTRVDKLVPDDGSRESLGQLSSYFLSASSYMKDTESYYTGAAYGEALWNASGFLATGHSLYSFKWATSDGIAYSKLIRSVVASGRSIDSIYRDVTVDGVTMQNLQDQFNDLREQ